MLSSLNCQQSNQIDKNQAIFLYGLDHTPLPLQHQEAICALIDSNASCPGFLVYDCQHVFSTLERMNELLPFLQINFNLQQNSCEELIQDLNENSCNFSFQTAAQLKKLLSLNVKLDQSVFNNQVKSENDLQLANQNEVGLTVADCVEEVKKIKRYSPDIRILYTIAVDEQEDESDDNDNENEDNNSNDTSNLVLAAEIEPICKQGKTTSFSQLYGEEFHSQLEIDERFTQIQSVGVSLEGLYFQISQRAWRQQESLTLQKTLELCRCCIITGRKYNHKMMTINIGSNFQYLSEQSLARLSAFKQEFPEVKIIGEPDIIISQKAFSLVSQIIGQRQIKHHQEHYVLSVGEGPLLPSSYLSFAQESQLIKQEIASPSVQQHMNKYQKQHNQNKQLLNELKQQNQVGDEEELEEKKNFYSLLDLKSSQVDIAHVDQQQDNNTKECSILVAKEGYQKPLVQKIVLPRRMKIGDWVCIGGMGGCLSHIYYPETEALIYRLQEIVDETGNGELISNQQH